MVSDKPTYAKPSEILAAVPPVERITHVWVRQGDRETRWCPLYRLAIAAGVQSQSMPPSQQGVALMVGDVARVYELPRAFVSKIPNYVDTFGWQALIDWLRDLDR